jgi:hypothetical protein
MSGEDVDLALSGATVTEIVSAVPPRPFDDRELRALIFDRWRSPKSRPPGEPGERLFEYLTEQLRCPGLDLRRLQESTLQLLSATRAGILGSDSENAFSLFVSYHRFFTLLTRSGACPAFAREMRPVIGEVLQWLIVRLQHAVMIDFRACTQQQPSAPGFDVSLARITRLRTVLALPIGDFVWARLIAAVDAELSNQLLDPQKYKMISAIRDGVGLVNAFTRVSGIPLPVFLQSMLLLLGYEDMIANKIPFEMMVRAVPPDFFVALIFAGKAKRLIRLEVSDQRLLKWAEYLKVDLEKIDSVSLTVDETQTEIPLSLWP